MNTYEFGKFVAQLRKEKGLTQIQLADKLNVTDKAISRWETGKNYPDIEMFENLSEVLDISVSELLEGKRVEKENLVSVSEKHIIREIKRNKKTKKSYVIIISVIVVLAILLGYLALKDNGFFDGVIYNKIDCYSNDVITIMNNVDGYITQTPYAEGEFIIDNGFFFMEKGKTTNDIFYLSGTCENGRAFYVNTLYDAVNPENSNCFIGEFRENRECAEGISFDELKCIVSQLDLSELPEYEKYELRITEFSTYDEFNVNSNELQKSIKKFIFENGVLQYYTDSFLTGKYLLITISGFNNGSGRIIAYIYYKN